jgi:hypothetical protein
MSKIKSAVELAMERTADIKIDKNALEREETRKQAKVLTSRYLAGEMDNLSAEIRKLEKTGKKDAVTAALEVINANIILPKQPEDLETLDRLEKGITDLTGEKKRCGALFTQLKTLLNQYLEDRVQIRENLSRQYEPTLRARERQIEEQTGRRVSLTPEQDPEFMKILSEQTGRFTEQYRQVLKRAKDEILNLVP